MLFTWHQLCSVLLIQLFDFSLLAPLKELFLYIKKNFISWWKWTFAPLKLTDYADLFSPRLHKIKITNRFGCRIIAAVTLTSTLTARDLSDLHFLNIWQPYSPHFTLWSTHCTHPTPAHHTHPDRPIKRLHPAVWLKSLPAASIRHNANNHRSSPPEGVIWLCSLFSCVQLRFHCRKRERENTQWTSCNVLINKCCSMDTCPDHLGLMDSLEPRRIVNNTAVP